MCIKNVILNEDRKLKSYIIVNINLWIVLQNLVAGPNAAINVTVT